MTKKHFIDTYILNFMATYDANHYCYIVQDLTARCTYAQAYVMAEGAWRVYEDGK